MTLGRRAFLRRFAAGGAILAPSLSGLAAWNFASAEDARAATARRGAGGRAPGYGPLRPSADCPELEIPHSFRCVRVSVANRVSPVRPSLTVPNAFDGMQAFAMPNGNIRLIRNHEMVDGPGRGPVLGWPNYDRKASGGTTTLEVRIHGRDAERSIEVVDEFVSLAGTRVNCAGGLTPWGSWLTCEENTAGRTHGFDRPHGYVFEVPASANGPVEPVALTAMGRFVHEAVAVDPDTGIVYETEDAWYVPDEPNRPGSGFYRFLPNRPGVLAEGGRLQVLAVPGRPRYLTARGMAAGTTVPAIWVDIEDPDPRGADTQPLIVFREGLDKGAAVFARLEGAFHGDGGIYIVSTNGGNARAGQVFHYRPTASGTGELTLVFESPSRDVLDSPDNIVLSPRGGIIMCEDGGGDQFIRGLDREGNIIDLVRHPRVAGRPAPGEFAGSCFSPDGEVMFFNVQGGREAGSSNESVTYALWGGWTEGPL